MQFRIHEYVGLSLLFEKPDVSFALMPNNISSNTLPKQVPLRINKYLSFHLRNYYNIDAYTVWKFIKMAIIPALSTPFVFYTLHET